MSLVCGFHNMGTLENEGKWLVCVIQQCSLSWLALKTNQLTLSLDHLDIVYIEPVCSRSILVITVPPVLQLPTFLNFYLLNLLKCTFFNNFKQAVGPGVLQTLSTCAVKS